MKLFRSNSYIIGDLLQNKTKFIVPDYQRPYSWSDDQFNDFWDSIYAQAKNPQFEDYLYFGPMYFQNSNDLSIVDGQQRLITISIFLLAVNKFMIDKNITKDPDLFKEYLKVKNKLRLVLKDEDQESLINLLNLPIPKRSKNKIFRAYHYFYGKLGSVALKNGKGECEDMINSLLYNSFVSVSIIESNNSVYEIFESLNSTGIALTPADLIKNLIYYKLEKKYRENFINKWEIEFKELDTKGDQFIQYFWFAYKGYTQKRNIFRDIKDTIKRFRQRKLLDFIDVIFEYLKSFNNIVEFDEDYWDDISFDVESMINMNITSLYPMLMLNDFLDLKYNEEFKMLLYIYFDLIKLHEKSNTYNNWLDEILGYMRKGEENIIEEIRSIFSYSDDLEESTDKKERKLNLYEWKYYFIKNDKKVKQLDKRISKRKKFTVDEAANELLEEGVDNDTI